MISAMLGTITSPHTRKGFWPVGSGNENAAFSFYHHVHALTGLVTTAVGCFKNLLVGFVATTAQLKTKYVVNLVRLVLGYHESGNVLHHKHGWFNSV